MDSVDTKQWLRLSLLFSLILVGACGEASQSSGPAVTPQSEQARLKTLVDQFQDTFCECYDPQNAFCDPAQRIQGPNYIAAGSCGAEVARCYPNDALDLYACINDRYERMDECAKACPADPAVCVPILTEQLPAECAPQIERFSELNTQCANGNMQCPVQQTPPPTTGGPNPNTPDPVFNSWKDSMREVAEYDCSCSQQSHWSPIWDENTCRNMWSGHIGRDQTVSCQYEELVNGGYKQRFYDYANCHIAANEGFLNCAGRGTCNGTGCVTSWNEARVGCNKDYSDIDSVVSNTCRAQEDFPLISALALVDTWFTGSGSRPLVESPQFLDLPDEFKSCSVNGCVMMYARFESSGVYKSFSEHLGGSYGGSTHGEMGLYGLDDVGRIYFTTDCQRSSNMNVLFAFQKPWFNIISLRNYNSIPSEAYIANHLNYPISPAEVCN